MVSFYLYGILENQKDCLTIHNRIIELINAFLFENTEVSKSVHSKEISEKQHIVPVQIFIEKNHETNGQH